MPKISTNDALQGRFFLNNCPSTAAGTQKFVRSHDDYRFGPGLTLSGNRLVDCLVRNQTPHVKQDHNRVGGDEYERLCRHLSNRQIVKLTWCITLYIVPHKFNDVMEIDMANKPAFFCCWG